MKNLLIIFMFYPVILFAQKEAIIIKHIGVSDHMILPVVITEDSIDNEFCEKHLRLYKSYVFKPRNVKQIVCPKEKINELKIVWTNTLQKFSDTTESKKYGSFEIVFIGTYPETYLIPSKESSVNFFEDILFLLGTTENSSLSEIQLALEYLIKEFYPNPTKEKVDKQD